MEILDTALTAVLAGDLSYLTAVRTADHADLQRAAARLPELSVSRLALINVLDGWRDGRWSDHHVQKWASFMRRGHAVEWKGGKLPIDISYDAHDEDLIAEIISRFDELGDLIDGIISDDEQREMLRSLLEQDTPT
jgi:hypothetical protein